MKDDGIREFLRGLAGRPILLALPALAAGIYVQLQYDQLLPLPVLLGLWIGWIALAVFSIRKSYVLSLILLIGGSFWLGILSQASYDAELLPSDHVLHHYVDRKMEMTAVVDRASERGRSSLHVSLSARICKTAEGSRRCSGRVKLFVSCDNQSINWRPGDLVRVNVRLRTFGDIPCNELFDFSDYMERRGYYVFASKTNSSSLKVIERAAESSVLLRLEYLREEMSAWIDEQVEGDRADVFKALILGMKGGIPRHIRDNFTHAGTAHLLAISGLHLGIMAFWVFVIVAGLWRRVPLLLRYRGANQVAAMVTLPATWLYAIMAGLHVATLRAAIMISIYMLARILWRRSDAINSLALAAFLILLASPYTFFEIGFQLSFLAVVAIVVGVGRLASLAPLSFRRKIRQKKWAWRVVQYLFFIGLTSLVCYLATLPLVVGTFHLLNLNGGVINLLTVPLFSLLLIPMLSVSAMLWFCHLPGGEALLWLAERVFNLTCTLQEVGLDLLGRSVIVPCLHWSVTPIYLSGFLIALLAINPLSGPRGRPRMPERLERRIKPAQMIAGLAMMFLSLIIAASHLFYFSKTDDGTRAVIPDLPDGNSVYLSYGDGWNAMVSPGRLPERKSDYIARSLGDILWDRCLMQIDMIYMLGDGPEENSAAERLSELVDVNAVGDLKRGTNCRTVGRIERCLSDEGAHPLVLWRLPGNFDSRGSQAWRGGRVVALEAEFENFFLLILPWHYRNDVSSVKALGRSLKRGPRVLLLFGPPKAELFDEMILYLDPDELILSLNSMQRRYLSEEKQKRMLEAFPKMKSTLRNIGYAIDKNGKLYVSF